MKIFLATTVLLMSLASANSVIGAVGNDSTNSTDDWKSWRQFNDFTHYTWAGFIKGWYRKSKKPISVDPLCNGDWIDSDLQLIYKVTN
jgi:hypothetical protein